ncbi:hypothetical protein FACS18945_2210 [Bacteroidia bacterium]|nr:hypothetical protein FACS18945_2210 [Bacteroidia bacterium]
MSTKNLKIYGLFPIQKYVVFLQNVVMIKLMIFMASISIAIAKADDAELKYIPNGEKETLEVLIDPPEAPAQGSDDKDSVVSISLKDSKDINWQGVMDTSHQAAAEAFQIILPFLPSMPLNNVELKLKILDRKF